MDGGIIPAARADLPRTYEAAKAALAECSALDECKDWADKAAALSSYAKQAQDGTLMPMPALSRQVPKVSLQSSADTNSARSAIFPTNRGWA